MSKRTIRGKRLQNTPYFISQDQLLGKGTYGSVYRVYNTSNPSQQLVVKIISLHQSANAESIETQMEMIREIPRHENLVNCRKAHIQSENNLYIIMEYCNQGSLQDYIKKSVLMPEDTIWDIMKQICRGYQVLYDAHLLHRDIKPQNILIHNKTFKLADFGLSKPIKDHSLSQNLSYAGSPLYIAPQIIDKNEGTSKIDVFSLGSVLYEMAYDGNNPFFKEHDKYKDPYEFYEKRKGMQLVLKEKNRKGQRRSQELRKLIKGMLEFDPKKRMSWEQIFSHPRININAMQQVPQGLERLISQQEQYLQQLRNSLVEVRKSSAKMCEIPQKSNTRSQSASLALQLISFQQFLEHSQLRSLQCEMFRLKITQLTILHCNNKINYLFRNQKTKRKMHKHIMETLQRVVLEGVLYLGKVTTVIIKKLDKYQPKVIKDIVFLLQKDLQGLRQQFKKQSQLFQHLGYQNQFSSIVGYDERRYQNQLYTLLTQYMDYPQQAKQQVMVIISILLDIYDSSLKLTQLIQTDRVIWQKYQDIAEIETKMDQFCYNKVEPQMFSQYLMKKEHTKLKDNQKALRKMGLLFT